MHAAASSALPEQVNWTLEGSDDKLRFKVGAGQPQGSLIKRVADMHIFFYILPQAIGDSFGWGRRLGVQPEIALSAPIQGGR